MANDTPLLEGFRIFEKHANAPDFVICAAVLTPEKLAAWVKANESLTTDYKGEQQIRVQILRSKEGKIYAKVDTYKASGAAASGPGPKTAAEPPSDLPF